MVSWQIVVQWNDLRCHTHYQPTSPALLPTLQPWLSLRACWNESDLCWLRCDVGILDSERQEVCGWGLERRRLRCCHVVSTVVVIITREQAVHIWNIMQDTVNVLSQLCTVDKSCANVKLVETISIIVSVHSVVQSQSHTPHQPGLYSYMGLWTGDERRQNGAKSWVKLLVMYQFTVQGLFYILVCATCCAKNRHWSSRAQHLFTPAFSAGWLHVSRANIPVWQFYFIPKWKVNCACANKTQNRPTLLNYRDTTANVAVGALSVLCLQPITNICTRTMMKKEMSTASIAKYFFGYYWG